MNKTALKLALGSLATALIGLSAPAVADILPGDVERFVKVCDSNKDGMISKAEVMKRAADMFDKMDTGKKGMMDDKKAASFLFELQKTDGNQGAMTSRADFLKKVEAAFDKTDAGKKGMIDSKQTMAFIKELMRSGG
jgi:hypothetical protein